MLSHVLPNVLAPVIVQGSLLIAYAIIVEATLSILGLGVQPPEPGWGSMLKAAAQYMQVAPWLPFFPGVAIFVTVLGLNLLGDGRSIRDCAVEEKRKHQLPVPWPAGATRASGFVT